MISETSIDYFNKSHPLIKLQGQVSLTMRRKMLACMPLEPGMRVLEVGATPNTDLPDSNFFSLQARAIGCEVWVTSPEDCSRMAEANGLHWLPFESFLNGAHKFDGVISSAVIEHVGAQSDNKRRHLELLKDASSNWLAITTPNRGHWLEFHTKIPLIHWLPKSTHRSILRQLNMMSWADPDHLDLVSSKEFERIILSVFKAEEVEFKRFWFLGAVSNLMALIEKST